MPEDKEERKKGSTGFLSYKRYWKAQLLLLLIFLLGFSFIAYFILGKQAYKLVGGDSYSELSRNSYGEKSIFKKVISYFVSDEALVDEKKSLEKPSFENSSVASAGKLDSGISSTENSAQTSGEVSFASRGSSMSSGARLASSLHSGLASASSGKSKTELSSFSGNSKNLSVGTIKADKANFKNGLARQQKPSALEALKGAWKASLYGARLSSQDAAKSWTARAFDSSPEAESSLQYSQKMKSKLDTLNPNAIPKYLKEQNIEMDALSSVNPSEVPEFDKDNSKKEEEMNASKEMREKLAQQISGGLFNSMYGGQPSSGEDSILERMGIEQPDSEASLGPNVTTDEYGSIRVTQDDGSIYIFDPDTGAIAGCEKPDEGFCFLPGAGDCPSDLAFV